MVALRMNDRYVSLAPARSYSAFFACRTLSTRWKFTSNTVWTCAEVRRLATMCSAIFRRITDIGTVCPASPAPLDLVPDGRTDWRLGRGRDGAGSAPRRWAARRPVAARRCRRRGCRPARRRRRSRECRPW